MQFGAGRGSLQIVEAGEEEGMQVPAKAQLLLEAFEEVGRLGHEGLTLQDGGEGGGSGGVAVQDGDEVEVDGVGDKVVDELEDKAGGGVVDVGGDIARQVEVEEDSDEGSEMEGDGKQVKEVGDSDGELGKVQVQEGQMVQEEGDNAKGMRDLEDGSGME